jgi:6-bladed beta-propeller
MKRNRKIRFFLCFIAAGAALTASSPGQKTYPVTTEVKDGVKTVMNPDFPRDGRFVAKLTEEMTCGEEGGPDEAILNKPLELRVDDQGRAYVMDWGDVTIKVYDADGGFLRTIGRQGQGPGEFGMGSWFELLSGGKLCILDGRQNRVTIMTTDGQYLSSFLVEGFHRNIAVDGQDRLYLGKWAAVKQPDGLSADYQEIPYVTSIFRTDVAGKDPAHLLDLLGESIMMKGTGGGGVVALGGGAMSQVVWAVDRGGKIYGGSNENLGLTVYGPDGKGELTFGRKFTPLKNPTAGQKKNLPAFGRTVVFDEEGNVWIELTKEEKQKELIYDVFSPDGVYLKQVRIEKRVGQFLKGKLYSLDRPEEGYPSVKRYRVDLVPAER